MSQLGSESFELGWIPSDDATRGRANGLVRMDNLNLDEEGNVSLTRGTLKVSDQFASTPLTLYSKTLSGTKHRYVGLSSVLFGANVVVKDVGEVGTFGTTVLSGGQTLTAYGATVGQVIICSGQQKKKDDGITIRNLGVQTPGVPTLLVSQQHVLDIIPDRQTLSVEEGTEVSKNQLRTAVKADTETFRIVVTEATPIDLTAVENGVTGTFSEDDQFTLWFHPRDSTRVQRVRVEFLLEDIPGTDEHVDNYFYHEWDFTKEFELINKGINQWSGLEAARSDYVKIGPDADLDWSNVRSLRIIIENSVTQEVALGEFKIEGGQGVLNGKYQYLQVNVWAGGKYEAISPASLDTDTITADHQFVMVTPDDPGTFGIANDPDEVDKIYIYRKNVGLGLSYTLVAIRTDLSQFKDNVSDLSALTGITGSTVENRTPNLFLIPVADFVVDMETNYFTRSIYITSDFIFVGDRNNPDAVDSRFTLDTSGEDSEKNLWITKVSNSSVLVGTTLDIYEIAGTGTTQPDGTIDFIIRPLGVKQAPISDAHAVYDNSVIYMSGSGWRILGGAQNASLVGHTRLLYDDEARHGIASVLIGSDNTVNYSAAVRKDKLFTSVTLSDGLTRRCYVYDFIKRYWYPYFLNPVDLFTEEDDTILGVFGDGGDEFIRQIDVGDILDVEPNRQTFELRTSYLDGGAPNNRKDLMVLKLYADSNDEIVTVSIASNGDDNYISLGDYQFNGPSIVNINLSETNANLGQSYSLKIVSTAGLHDFKFYYWNIVFEPRPEQINYLRVPPTAFKVAGRKRFYDLPFSLDARGNNFIVTPVLDGVLQTVEAFNGNSSVKDFYSIAFRDETIGHEMGIDIQVEGNGVVEFYELLNPRHTEVLPDLARWFRIPFTNLGTPSRKRFVRIALVIDTRGQDVRFTPLVDSTSLPSETINTNRKETYIYFVKNEVVGTDLGGILDGLTEQQFEFYDWDADETVTEALPAPAKFIFACTDFGTAARKRFSRNSFVLNPRGGSISFEPILDGVRQGPKTFSGNRKETFSYYYLVDKVFVDLCYEIIALTDEPFEFYDLLKPERLELLPEPTKFFRIPRTNLDTDSRKRFHAFALFLNTRGHSVRFTPYVDGVAQSETTVFNTTTESTVIHYFRSETIGHDIGGNLETVEGESALPFEFYGINFDDTVTEKVPGPAKFIVIPPTNYGVAARKRVRTIPLVINTRGNDVTYTPFIDGVAFPSSVFNTTEKRTVLHHIEEDAFGIDIGGTLESAGDPFEFYSFETPEVVEVLPVSKKFDQVGPAEYPRATWLRRFRIRMVATGTSLVWRIYDKDVELDNGTIVTTANKEIDYDVPMIKGVRGTVFRITFKSDDAFHRHYVDIWHAQSG